MADELKKAQAKIAELKNQLAGEEQMSAQLTAANNRAAELEAALTEAKKKRTGNPLVEQEGDKPVVVEILDGCRSAVSMVEDFRAGKLDFPAIRLRALSAKINQAASIADQDPDPSWDKRKCGNCGRVHTRKTWGAERRACRCSPSAVPVDRPMMAAEITGRPPYPPGVIVGGSAEIEQMQGATSSDRGREIVVEFPEIRFEEVGA